jgi:hypothetical protein
MINTEEVTKAIANQYKYQLDESRYITESIEKGIREGQKMIENHNRIYNDHAVIKVETSKLLGFLGTTPTSYSNKYIFFNQFVNNKIPSDKTIIDRSEKGEIMAIIRKIKFNAYCIERKGDTQSPDFIYIIENHKTKRYLMQDYLSNR